MSDADIARRIAGEYSLDPDVDGGSGVLDHVLQSNETDLAFLTRRAARIGFDCWVTNKTLHFKRKPQGEGQPPTLRWGENLQRFSVRFSAIERCDEVVTRGWDPLGQAQCDRACARGGHRNRCPSGGRAGQRSQKRLRDGSAIRDRLPGHRPGRGRRARQVADAARLG